MFELFKFLAKKSFTGRWVGQYTYGDEYPDRIVGKSVLFEIKMHVRNGKLSGRCMDDPSVVDYNNPAIIKGKIKRNEISFVKKYAHHLHDPAESPNDVHYTGLFLNNRFEGEWKISDVQMYENGVSQVTNNSGTWTMEKRPD